MVYVSKKLEQNMDNQYYIDFYESLRILFFAELIALVLFFIRGWEIESIALIIRIVYIFFAVVAFIMELIVWYRLFTFYRKVNNYPLFIQLTGMIGSVFLLVGPGLILLFEILWQNNVLNEYNGFLGVLLSFIIYVIGYLSSALCLIFIPKSVLEETTWKIIETEEQHENILEVKNLSKVYSSGIIRVSKVIGAHNVNFVLKRGEILSIVGESGSGKSTVANMILRLIEPSAGEIVLNGVPINEYSLTKYYNQVQAIFQDPYGSFNQFYKIDRVLEDAFNIRAKIQSKKLRLEKKWTSKEIEEHFVKEKKSIINDVLHKIGLNPNEVLGRYPHQLSGGQLQRFLLARVLILEPDLLIADEMTSMIDASSRAGILNLLEQLKEDMSVLFITHDIGQAQYISDNIIVMEKGNVVEKGPVTEVLTKPKHRYTQELLKAVPKMEERWEFLQTLGNKS
jgi:peptide/nickel transport system ATP-binding protein